MSEMKLIVKILTHLGQIKSPLELVIVFKTEEHIYTINHRK